MARSMRALCLFGLCLAAAVIAYGQQVALMPLAAYGISESDAEFMAERLMIELVRSGDMEVMERQRRDELLREQDFQQSGACEAVSCLVEAGRILSVSKIVGGSIGQIGQVVSIQIRLIDLETGRVERSVDRDYSGVEDLLTQGLQEVARELSGKSLAPTQNLPSRRPPDVPQIKPTAQAEPLRKRPISRLKAPGLTYSSLALGTGGGMIYLICRNQQRAYDDKGDERNKQAYRDKTKTALATAAGCLAISLTTSFFKRPAAEVAGGYNGQGAAAGPGAEQK